VAAVVAAVLMGVSFDGREVTPGCRQV